MGTSITTTPVVRRSRTRVVAVVSLLGVLAAMALAVVVTANSASSLSALAGLPDSGVLTRIGLPALRVVAQVSSVVCVGALMIAAVLGTAALIAAGLLVGFVFFTVVLDPRPHPARSRATVVIVATALFMGLCVVLVTSTSPIGANCYRGLGLPWLSDLLLEQRLGGAYALLLGFPPLLAAWWLVLRPTAGTGW